MKILGTAVLSALDELKSHADPPVFVVTSTSLAYVPGVVKSNVQAEPAVTARIDNIEKMIENLAKSFTELKNDRPALQLNGVPLQQQSEGVQHVPGNTGKPQFGGARPKEQLLPPGGLGLRARSDSRERKRKAEEDLQQPSGQGQGQGQGQQGGWNDVVRGRRKVQYGTSQVRVAGGEAAPYDVFVGNTLRV